MRIVWADAICINQKDIEERNNQVPLMGSIYPLARRVIVWLGPADPEHTETALKVLKMVGAACRIEQRGREVGSIHDEIKCLFDCVIKCFTPAVCASLDELFTRPWFSRIWCVQEIRLASDALVLCGEYEVSWETLSLAVAWIGDGTVDNEKLPYERPDGIFRSIQTGPAGITCNDMAIHLQGLLHNCCEFQSTDPRDRVHGLLSLVDPGAEVEAIDVDYNKSIGAVFATLSWLPLKYTPS